ncbi:hypothetical protein [Streptomyces sp. GESEQ-35]|uniref:hypothetical protein n=1 Tax=Streptomyces sp. GESEQ-35 TaxID=2812657 RepID=UPI001B318BEC|nr:hypothetical protein [Streptomyces sp. GESEQ-35]
MGTAERREAPGDGNAAQATAQRIPEARDRGIPATDRDTTDGRDAAAADAGAAVRVSVAKGGAGAVIQERVAEAGAGTDTKTRERAPETGVRESVQEQPNYRQLWVEEPTQRRRMPDPVRTAAVRAVLVIAVTLIQAMVAFLCTLAGSWLAFPMVLSSVASTVVATWGALDVWVTRQVWNQRNGVVSIPSSTARALRRERRRARRQERNAERAQERIRSRGGAGQLSHS